MGIFDIDYSKLSKQLLPVMLRKTMLVKYLAVMVSPIVRLYEFFTTHRASQLYELDHNGQVCRLEAVLNDRFDNTLRRIYIEDARAIFATPLYRRVENKPVYLRRRSENKPVYLRRRAELTHGGAFVVKVPTALTFDTEEMKALINKYKMAGKTYAIKTF